MRTQESTAVSRRRFIKRLMVFVGLLLWGKGLFTSARAEKQTAANQSARRSATPFLAEVMMFAGNFAPRGWLLCNGQLMPLSQNTALFSLLGTSYGGDGRTTFGLPNLIRRFTMAWGNAPGLSSRDLGETGGEASVTLITSEMPAHSHSLIGTLSEVRPRGTTAPVVLGAAKGGDEGSSSNTLSVMGGGQPHNNMPPYLAVTFCIATQGIYPSRP